MSYRVALFVATVGFVFGITPLRAQVPSQLRAIQKEVAIPSSVNAWANSSPLTDVTIRGKAVLFYCFEEGCPAVRASWSQLLETTKQFADQPILFVAVNSGTPASDVRKYVRDVELPWPVLIDEDRAFERALLQNEISLKNIYQIVVRLPDGKWAEGDWSDVAGTATRSLVGAKWKIDPAGIPASLKTAWRQAEFGDYASSATAITSAAQSPQPEEAAAAKRLLKLAEEELLKQLSIARAASAAGDKWGAYKQFQAAESDFKGYALAAEAGTAVKLLSTDVKVRKELAAAKQWNAILSGPKPKHANAMKAVVAQVQRFAAANADTDAGRAAQAALDQLAAQP